MAIRVRREFLLHKDLAVILCKSKLTLIHGLEFDQIYGYIYQYMNWIQFHNKIKSWFDIIDHFKLLETDREVQEMCVAAINSISKVKIFIFGYKFKTDLHCSRIHQGELYAIFSSELQTQF